MVEIVIDFDFDFDFVIDIDEETPEQRTYVFLEFWVFHEAPRLELASIGAKFGRVDLDKVLVAEQLVSFLNLEEVRKTVVK